MGKNWRELLRKRRSSLRPEMGKGTPIGIESRICRDLTRRATSRKIFSVGRKATVKGSSDGGAVKKTGMAGGSGDWLGLWGGYLLKFGKDSNEITEGKSLGCPRNLVTCVLK